LSSNDSKTRYDVFNVETGEGMMAQWDTNPGNKQETFRKPSGIGYGFWYVVW